MPLAVPVSVSTIVASGGTVTVTTVGNHNLSVNQGFSLQGDSSNLFSVNSTVVSVTNSTTFTFNSSLTATSNGGKVSPAKEIIILGTNSFQTSGSITVQYLLWLTTTNPQPGTSASQWKGASLQENSALFSGTTVEISRSITLSSTITKAQIEAAIQQDFIAQQAAFASAPQPGAFYGVIYDGTGWSS